MLEFVRRFCIEVCRYTTFVSQRDTNTKERYVNKLLTIGNLPANSLLVTLDVSSLYTNALISGHPGGLTPGTYGGIARDLLTFVANCWPWTGALDRFCTSEARYTWKDPRDL